MNSTHKGQAKFERDKSPQPVSFIQTSLNSWVGQVTGTKFQSLQLDFSAKMGSSHKGI